ncbi:hypothetical protein AK812_SmicGene15498 [Symbiodinium microadriaticum]|uniref:Uncharacterized protein n=1 Tax=Symbiodinium microadriaticum TaxID=2951 RepID=A0A1Q9E2Q5_SYMMI|nr:hypothetical protein AK812_SmicGene15498 [Symbiodinium microadriaticum]
MLLNPCIGPLRTLGILGGRRPRAGDGDPWHFRKLWLHCAPALAPQEEDSEQCGESKVAQGSDSSDDRCSANFCLDFVHASLGTASMHFTETRRPSDVLADFQLHSFEVLGNSIGSLKSAAIRD